MEKTISFIIFLDKPALVMHEIFEQRYLTVISSRIQKLESHSNYEKMGFLTNDTPVALPIHICAKRIIAFTRIQETKM